MLVHNKTDKLKHIHQVQIIFCFVWFIAKGLDKTFLNCGYKQCSNVVSNTKSHW